MNTFYLNGFYQLSGLNKKKDKLFFIPPDTVPAKMDFPQRLLSASVIVFGNKIFIIEKL